MPEISYKYFGILYGDRTADNPAGVVRVWTGPDGTDREQTFTPELTWETSFIFDSLTRPDSKRLVEIDRAAADRFVEKIKRKFARD